MSERSRIFISYSHKDRDRADFLCEELRAREHPVLIDHEGIAETELITPRIREMIQSADLVCLVLGPNWLASSICRMEMQLALEFNKRILPAAFEDVGAELPDEIKDINYVRFYGPGGEWKRAIERLVSSVDHDIDWVRDHSRYLERAARWQVGNGGLLSGRELSRMRDWSLARPEGAPELTALQGQYLRASLRRRKWTRGISGSLAMVSLVAATIGSFFFYAGQQCDELRRRALSAPDVEPVEAIRLLLPVTEMSLCRDEGDWMLAMRALVETMRRQRLRAEIHLEDPEPHFVNFMPDSNHLIVAQVNGDPLLLEARTGRRTGLEVSMPEPSETPARLQHASGRVVRLSAHRVSVWDAERGGRIGLPYRTLSLLQDAALSGDGSTLVVADQAGQVVFHSLSSGRATRPPLELSQSVSALRFVPYSTRVLAVTGAELTVISLSPNEEHEETQAFEVEDQIDLVAMSSDGSTLAVTSGSGMEVRALATLEQLIPFTDYYGEGTEITALALAPDGRRVAVATSDNRLQILDLVDDKNVESLPAGRNPIVELRYSPRGDLIFSRDDAGTIRVFDITSGLETTNVPVTLVETVIASNRTGQNAGQIRVEGQGFAAIVRPDQKDQVSLEHDEESEATSGYYAEVLNHQGAFISSMSLSPDERLLVTAAEDGQVRVWDVHTGLLLYRFVHSERARVPFIGADFSPSGQHVVSWDSSGSRRVWAVQPLTGDLFQSACRLLPFHNGERHMPAEVELETEFPDPCDSAGFAMPERSAEALSQR